MDPIAVGLALKELTATDVAKAGGALSTGILKYDPAGKPLSTFQKAANLVFSDSAQAPGYALSSIYWFHVFPAYRYLPNPPAKYFGYYSTDHDSGQGGIAVALSNSPNGPWVQYQPATGAGSPVLPGCIFIDRRKGAAVNSTTIADGDGQSETPSVIWDSKLQKVRLFYHNILGTWVPPFTGVETTSANGQSTLSATSSDGLTGWTKDTSFIIEQRTASQAPGGHSGYFNTFMVDDRYYAYHLIRDTNRPLFGLSMSADGGSKWSTDPRELGLNMHNVPGTPARFVSWNHCVVVRMGNGLKLIGIASDFTSGSTPKNARIFIAPIADDLRTLLAEVQFIWEPTLAWESADLRSLTAMIDNGALYIYYMCKTGAGAQNVGVLTYGL